MTAYISERSRNSKGLKKYDPPKNESGSYFFNYFEFLLLSEIEATVCQSLLIFLDSPFTFYHLLSMDFVMNTIKVVISHN